MQFIRKYGTAFKIRIPVVKAASSDFAVGADWTPATGDVKISKDGGAAANITTLPAAIAMGNGAIWEFAVSATEAQAAEITITVVDSATKAVQDQALSVITFGNASAGIQPDWSDVVRMGLTALPNAAAEAAGGLYTRGSGAGQINQPANGMIDANVVRNAGTAITAAAGVQEVKVASLSTGAIVAGSFAAGAIDNAAIATDAIGSAELASSAVTEIQSGLSTLDAAGVRAAVGLASANLDTQLAAIAGYIDTEVGAIKTKTDQLTFTVSNQVDVNVVDWKGSVAPAMTGDAFARLGAPAGASVAADIAAVKAVDDAVNAKTDDLPTNAELATALAGADDATLAAIAALNNISQAQVKAQADAALADAGVTTTMTGRIDAAITTRLAGAAYTAPDNATIAAIDAKTTNLPSDPADESLIIAATNALATSIGALPTTTTVNAIKAKTDLVPDTIDGKTFAEHVALQSAVLLGKASGLGGTTVHFRSLDDAKNRVVATVDSDGNRSAVTLDAG